MFFASKKESATLYMNSLSILKLDNVFKLKIATVTYKTRKYLHAETLALLTK